MSMYAKHQVSPAKAAVVEEMKEKLFYYQTMAIHYKDSLQFIIIILQLQMSLIYGQKF